MARVTVIGLGTMGRGMAANLLRAKHEVTVWNRSAGRAGDLLEHGALEAASIAEAVAGAEFVLYCLSDDGAVHDVVLGADGLAELVPSTAVVVDLSTISPEASAEVRAAFERRGVRFPTPRCSGRREKRRPAVYGSSPAATMRRWHSRGPSSRRSAALCTTWVVPAPACA